MAKEKKEVINQHTEDLKLDKEYKQLGDDVRQVILLRSRGLSFRKIAKEVGVTVKTAYVRYQKAREWYKEIVAEHYEDHIAREFEKIDAIEDAAWNAFFRSQGQRTTTTEKVKSKGEEGEETDTTVRTVHEAGDPRFLVIIGDCVDRRARLLGTIKQDEVKGKTLSDVLAIAREGKTVEYYQQGIKVTNK